MATQGRAGTGSGIRTEWEKKEGKRTKDCLDIVKEGEVVGVGLPILLQTKIFLISFGFLENSIKLYFGAPQSTLEVTVADPEGG